MATARGLLNRPRSSSLRDATGNETKSITPPRSLEAMHINSPEHAPKMDSSAENDSLPTGDMDKKKTDEPSSDAVKEQDKGEESLPKAQLLSNEGGDISAADAQWSTETNQITPSSSWTPVSGTDVNQPQAFQTQNQRAVGRSDPVPDDTYRDCFFGSQQSIRSDQMNNTVPKESVSSDAVNQPEKKTAQTPSAKVRISIDIN